MINFNSIQSIFLKSWRPYAWIILIIFIIFSQTLFFDYVYLDDNALILEQNHYLTDWSNFSQTFKEDAFHRTSGDNFYYRPLLTLSFMLDAHINGTETLFFFHLTNILLHILVVIFLFILLKLLNIQKKWAFLASLIFALHPITLQATAFIAGRNDSLLGIFLLPAFITTIYAIQKKSLYWWLFSIPLYIASLFTKETAIAFLPLIIIYLFLFNNKKIKWIHYIWTGATYIIITSIWLYIRSLALNSSLINQFEAMFLSMLENSISIISYIGKIFIPVNLSVLPVAADLPLIYGIVSIIALGLLIYFNPHKNKALIIFGFGWFILLLLPGLIQHSMAFPSFSEHRAYLPMMGLAIVIASLKFNFKDKFNSLIPIFIIIIIISLGVINIKHANVYKNRLNFWEHAAISSPSSTFNHNNLGAMHYLDGNYSLAEQEWIKANQLNPQEKLVQNNLGLIYAARGEFEKAYNAYLKELTINPDYPNTHFNLGLLLYNTNNIEQALTEWEKTIELDPNYILTYEYIASHYISVQELDKAKEYVNQMIDLGGIPNQELLDKLK